MKKNIILTIEGGIGHQFNNTPIIKHLKQNYPESNLIVFTPFLEVFRFNPHIDELLHLDDTSTNMNNLYKRIHNNFQVFNPSVYRTYQHLDNDDGLHIKQIIAKQCGIDIDRSEPLEYYPTKEETDKAQGFKDLKCQGKKLGIVQMSGAGIGNNATANLKELPLQTMREVIGKTSNEIFWIQIRLPHEKSIPGIGYELVDYPQRKVFALLSVADIGLGTDSFSQHFMSGVYDIPYVLCLGRGRKENYAHDSAIVVENPESCEYFGCEFPFFGVQRMCSELKCMESITSNQIIKKIKKCQK